MPANSNANKAVNGENKLGTLLGTLLVLCVCPPRLFTDLGAPLPQFFCLGQQSLGIILAQGPCYS